MIDTLEIGDPAITVMVKRSARARRLSLRVSRLDGRVNLTLPRRTPLFEGRSFVIERESWLRAQLAQVEPQERPAAGGQIPFCGTPHILCAAPLRVPRREGSTIWVPDAPDRVRPALRAWLREEARARLVAASGRYADQIGRSYSKITLRDTRSRWGSCTSNGGLMYSWRLVMAPEAVLTYVAAHEVAHLAEMNHSPAFWQVVEGLDPDWRQSRDWLRHHGAALHRVRFDD